LRGFEGLRHFLRSEIELWKQEVSVPLRGFEGLRHPAKARPPLCLSSFSPLAGI